MKQLLVHITPELHAAAKALANTRRTTLQHLVTLGLQSILRATDDSFTARAASSTPFEKAVTQRARALFEEVEEKRAPVKSYTTNTAAEPFDAV